MMMGYHQNYRTNIFPSSTDGHNYWTSPFTLQKQVLSKRRSDNNITYTYIALMEV